MKTEYIFNHILDHFIKDSANTFQSSYFEVLINSDNTLKHPIIFESEDMTMLFGNN